jgi:hypothetical protein
MSELPRKGLAAAWVGEGWPTLSAGLVRAVKYVLIRANTLSEHQEGPVAAMIEVDYVMAQRLLRLVERCRLIKDRDPDFVRMEFWESVTWIDFSSMPDEFEEAILERSEVIALSTAPELTPADTRMDCERLSVNVSGVNWTGYIKHADNTTVETEEVSFDFLRGLYTDLEQLSHETTEKP